MTNAADNNISSKNPVVILHGDEMAQIAFEMILERLVRARTSVPLVEHDLSALNRLRTNGAATKAAIADIKKHKTGVKNAGITVNAAQKAAMIAELNASENAGLSAENLAPEATKSPNGTIRKQIGGNISREDIPFTNVKKRAPDWKNRDFIAVTMEQQGTRHAPAARAPESGALELVFTPAAGGDAQALHTRDIGKGDPFLLSTVDIEALRFWTRELFSRALKEKRHVYLGLKDTVLPGYDGVMRTAIDAIYKDEFAEAFTGAGITYSYALIDAQAASIVTRPPENALWAMPDNATGDVFVPVTEALKNCGFPSRGQSMSVSRMSAGGGDQYGSYQIAAPANGTVSARLNGKEILSRPVTSGSPVMIMSNSVSAIKTFADGAFAEAAAKGEFLTFGLDQELAYDEAFIEAVEQTAAARKANGDPMPEYAISDSASMLRRMFCDPPAKGRYACRNLEGDIVSDVTAAYGGSLATAASAIIGDDGISLYEAPHGTAPDLYDMYQKSAGATCIFNPAALIFALAASLKSRARLDGNAALTHYADMLEKALIDTVDAGTVTADIADSLKEGVTATKVDLPGFLDATEKRLDTLLAQSRAA